MKAGLLIFPLFTFVLTGCTSTRMVTVPERHEVVAHQRDTTLLRDSIFVHDSIFVTHRGDTVLMREYHTIYRDRWRDRLRVDSFIQRDTVTVVKEVEKPTSGRQKLNPLIAVPAIALVAYVLIRKMLKMAVS